MIKRLTILFFFFGCSICSLFADDEENLRNYYNTLLPDFQQMSPEASALGKYGNYSTSGFTGVPSISIPLFGLNSGNYTMPVNLTYDASGIKVEQQATYVGLGWNLIMGGSISQIVCGKTDFSTNSYATINNSDLLQDVIPEMDYVSSPYACHRSIAFPAVPTNGAVLPFESDRRKYDVLRSVSDGLEIPDIFQASFCGHSVSFVINKNRSAFIIDNDATNYTIELKNYSGLYPRIIEITDDYGQKYVFAEAPHTSMYENASYALSEIRNAAGRCLIKFKYRENAYVILHPYYETQGKRDESYDAPIASESIQRMFIDRNYPNTLGGGIKTYCPDTILTDREVVTFAYGNRKDIKGAKRMEQISVKSRTDNSLIHTIDFQYDNFAEESCDIALSSRYGYNAVYGNSRLKLTGITVDGKTYSFGYDEEGGLPSRLCLSQDFWGYYNGQNNSNGFCASPEFRFNGSRKVIGTETVGSANRYASEEDCKRGILNRITYPTGGYAKFYYEVNHFDDIEGRYYYPSATSVLNVKSRRIESCGSGFTGSGYKSIADSVEFDISESTKVDIKSNSPHSPDQYYKLFLSIAGKDSIGHTVFSKSWTKCNHENDFEETYTLPKGHYVLTSQFGDVTNGLIISSNIMVYFPPEYSEVSSIADASGKSIGGGLRIKTIENYDNDNMLLEYTHYKYEGGKLLLPTAQIEHISMAYLHSCSSKPDLFVIPSTLDCRFFFINSSPTFPAICSLGSPNVGYSKITKERYGKTGQLISFETEKYYNEGYHIFGGDGYFNLFSVNFNGQNGKLMESTTFSADSIPMLMKKYSFTTLGNDPALENIVFFPWARCLNMNPGYSSLDVNFKYSLYPKYPITVLPSSMTETQYVNGSPMQPIVTSYSYKASNFQPTEVIKTTPTNDVVSTKYWYPDDSQVSSSNTQCLTDAHCISEKVKALEVRNGNTVGGYRNYYGVSNDLPVVIQNFSIAADGSERSELHVTKYDEYGNICEYTKNDGTPVTIIWSYNHQCPVLEIIGDTYEHVKNMSVSVSALENMVEVPAGLIASIHSSLANAALMVTAYEYSPWLTVSRIISPNGYTVDYSYDDHGRLVRKNDADGVIQKYEYNYKH